MDHSITQKILEKISTEELERRIKDKIKLFNGFITREVAIRLIARDMGIRKEKTNDIVYKIKDVPENKRGVSILGTITKIMPTIVYPSKKKSKSMVVKDETGYISVKLWNDDIELMKRFKIGDRIRVTGGYTRNRVLNLGYRGKIDVIVPSQFTDLDKLPERDYVNVRGFVDSIEGYGYYNPDQKANKYFDFTIKSEDMKSARCRIEFASSRGEKIKENDEIILEHAYVKNGIIRIYSSTRMRKREVSGLVKTKVKDITCDDGYVIIKGDTEGKDVTLSIPWEEFYEFMGISVGKDITLKTIIDLKKKYIIGKMYMFKSDYVKDLWSSG